MNEEGIRKRGKNVVETMNKGRMEKKRNKGLENIN